MKRHIIHLFAAIALAACGGVHAQSGVVQKMFVQKGVGAVPRPFELKAQEVVSVKDFGAKGDNVTDDQPAIQKALNTGKSVYLPNGIYRVNSFLLMSTVGQRMYGESLQNVYLTTAAGSTHDILRVAGSLSEVSGILFRPGSVNNLCIRLYGASIHVHGNRFLAAVNGSGTALLMTDQNPLGGTVAGAYTHVIENNHFGAGGYSFAIDIDESSLNGIQATKFLSNKHLSDRPIRLTKGGANTYIGNLFQSATGTAGAKAGNGVDIGADIYAEMISGNYFELYQNAILSRAATATYQAFRSVGNHFDNNANNHVTLVTSNFVAEDAIVSRETRNGWTDTYASQATRIFNGLSGGTALLTLDETNKAIKTNKRYSTMGQMNFTADGQTVTPNAEHVVITGSGAGRINCTLGVTGVQDGQRLTLIGMTWPVTLNTTNARFASGSATVTFGNTAGQVQAMELVYYAAIAKWIEINRVIY